MTAGNSTDLRAAGYCYLQYGMRTPSNQNYQFHGIF